jgi:hypothetical protein
MVWNLQGTSNLFDLSFMYSRECNLRCPFCMYNSGPEVKDRLSLSALYDFIQTIPMDRINSPSASMAANQRCSSPRTPGSWAGCHEDKPRFMISNGYWSRDQHDATIVKWYAKHFGFKVFVSSTAAHQRVQDAEILAKICRATTPNSSRSRQRRPSSCPMGRLAGQSRSPAPSAATGTRRPLRLAVQPDGSVIFQTCDGVVSHRRPHRPRLPQNCRPYRGHENRGL